MRNARSRSAILGAFALCALPLRAASEPARAPIARRAVSAPGRLTPQAAQATTAFSTEVPLVAHINATAPVDTLVLSAGHPFTITLTARDPRTGTTGTGLAIPENDIFGFFSIPAITGNSSNPEVFVKIIDGRALNNAYWVFYNGLTDLEYTLTVRENATGRTKVYLKPAGNTACGAQDTSAFPVTAASLAAEKLPLDLDALNVPSRTSVLRTSVDFTNTTNVAITVEYQYSYTCVAAACSPVGLFTRTSLQTFVLNALDSRHFDDFVASLAAPPSLLAAGAEQGSYGTLLVTFRGVPSAQGSEATVQARTYSRVVESDPLKGTVGYATPASLFGEAATSVLVGTARDTRGAPGVEGTLSSNVGIRNSDVNGSRFPGTDRSVTVDLTFYNTATGQRVGGSVPLAGLRPGEVREVTDIWTAAGIPSSVHTVVVFADIRGATAQSATIEGYITIDDVNSKDSVFYELKCADTVCGQ
ncbi:MAG: hypothetical protein LC796_12030 [Acidobacteria bacterium]|nr:hypothetical protein [Acidobacteriota bacterium]MCA1610849.1 hypothetical protein [Acidobacteriota bacterium]